ncbi:MAG: hypothetical protein JXO49_05705 [Deltaproteobacteria bacterium]|nr:hypothetical protein [Candidatus Anaeroferrophillus wilburensis]MBN2888821.1 hypothetical protein [Deltaproteobacteria bacterium]
MIPCHQRFILLLLLCPLAFSACAPLTSYRPMLQKTIMEHGSKGEIQTTLEKTKQLIREGMLQEAKLAVSSLHQSELTGPQKNEYHFLTGLIFALKEYENRNYQRSLRHLKQVENLPEDRQLYPIYSSLLADLLTDIIQEYYQIKELEQTIDQLEKELLSQQNVNRVLEDENLLLRQKTRQLQDKIKEIMKIDTE